MPSAPLRRGKVPQKYFWEGINLNKISKKIVSLVTMAAFVLTLVPAAAFAADTDPVADKSTYKVEATGTAGELKVTVNLKDKNGTAAETACNSAKVYVEVPGIADTTTVNATGTTCSTAAAAKAGVAPTGANSNEVVFIFTGLKNSDTYTPVVKLDLDGDSTTYEPVQIDPQSAEYASAYVIAAADYQASKFMTVKQNVEVSTGETVDAVLRILNGNGAPGDKLDNVYVWAEDEAGNITTAATFTSADTNKVTVAPSSNPKVFSVDDKSQTYVTDGAAVKVSFNRGGIYTLHAAVLGNESNIQAGDTAKAVFENTDNSAQPSYFGGDVTGYNTVKVNEATTAVKSIKVDTKVVEDGATEALTAVQANNSDVKSVDITAYALAGGNGKTVAGKELTITSNSANLVLSGDTTTNANGKVTLKYQAKATGKYTITVAADSYKAYLTVQATGVTNGPDKITTVVDNKVAELTSAPDFSDAVQFKVVDKNGNEVSKDNKGWDTEAIWLKNNDDTNVAKYVEIVDQPTGAKLTDSNVFLTYDDADGVYTLAFKNVSTANLKEGEYTVRLSLSNNNSVEATFSLAKAGDPVSIEIDGKDTAKAGEPYTAKLFYVDKNGIKTAATGSDIVVGYTATNSVAGSPTPDMSVVSDNIVGFTPKSDSAYFGTEVTLYAINANEGLSQTKKITVVDPSVAETVTLNFDKTSGPIAQDNTVKVTLKDENGNTVKDITSDSVSAYVAKKSVEDAVVNVTAENTAIKEGTGTISVYADKATTADIVIAVEDGGKIYAGTLTYAFGEQDIPVDTTVVMTIGSNDLIVNNDVVTVKDAAPYIANDRTYVPFRALGEALGAEVVWDNDARTVTYTLGSTEVVMTIGEKTYTVNGEEKTMDVAPEITNDRTYVPVRFVGEALGFKVTALSAADGTTASVVFQK